MSKSPKLTDWSKENPPMIGEYNASISRDTAMLRWWDGERWSLGYMRNESERIQRRSRRCPASASTQVEIEWRGLAEQPKNFVAPQPLGPL